MLLRLKIPPVAVALVIAGAMWLVAKFTPQLRVMVPGRLMLAASIATAGGVVAVLGLIEFWRARTSVDPMRPDRASMLVTSGVYRVTRNPMYLGLLLVLLAWAFVLGHVLALAGLPGFIAYMNRFQIRPEEEALARRFGAGFSDYARTVRRWL